MAGAKSLIVCSTRIPIDPGVQRSFPARAGGCGAEAAAERFPCDTMLALLEMVLTSGKLGVLCRHRSSGYKKSPLHTGDYGSAGAGNESRHTSLHDRVEPHICRDEVSNLSHGVFGQG